jgi:hypothetical protein
MPDEVCRLTVNLGGDVRGNIQVHEATNYSAVIDGTKRGKEMAQLIIVLTYFIGYGASARTYYRRRCGIIMRPRTGYHASAFILSLVWPVMWFVESYRSPQLCNHYSHVLQREKNRQMAQHYHELLQQEQTRPAP